MLDILKHAESTWREIARLATPIDADKPVVISSKPKTPIDFEAYTDNRKIYINLDEKKFKKSLEHIVVPAYQIAASRLYDVPNSISKRELLTNLAFDTFLFMHFHEQLHPWLCPNSRHDEKTISKTLYDGIKKAEPGLSKAEAMFKVNNCKNLVWDIILNIGFVSKTAGYNNENLEQKIRFVFKKNNRQIELQPITHYPSGILPIVYMISAQKRTTDIPISLVGAMYSTMSYNDSDLRQKAMEVFLDDLESKKMSNQDVLELLKKMYKGFVSELDRKKLEKKGIDKDKYRKKVSMIADFANPDYELNQEYLTATLTKIFDTPSLRYEALKGFIKILSPYISLAQKQGSPDPNTMGHGQAGDAQQEGQGEGEGDAGEKSQEDMDGDSMAQTLDDLMETLDGDEADELMGEVANDQGMSSGRGGAPSAKTRKKIAIIAADEFYKKNADVIEVHNPSEENVSYDIGAKKVWKLKNSQKMTAAEVSKLNHQHILAFQNATGLPVLMELGSGFYRLNEYKLIETPLKSYSTQLNGIEIPDNWVLFQDSSSSMASPYYIGSGDRFDILNRVKYGISKGLYQICKTMGKDLSFGVVDFSNFTVYRGMESLIKLYEAKTHPIKTISLTPQCGGTACNPQVFKKVEKDLRPGKTICTFITDGEIQGNTDLLYREIERFSANPQNAFVFVEIASSSQFGQEVHALSRANPSVMYYRVKNVKSIKDKLSSVLIRYS